MGPLLRLTGAGTVNLGQRQIEATLRPRVVSALSGQAAGQSGGQTAGQGAGGELSGLELPFKIKGPWEKPSITPDMDGLLKNPGAADAIREVTRQLQQGKGGAAINNLIEQFRRR